MQKLKAFFSGKKTHLTAVAAILFCVAVLFGWVEATPEQQQAILGLAGGVAFVCVRLAVQKLGLDPELVAQLEDQLKKKPEGPPA